MKRLLLLSALFLFLAFPALAQVKVGVKAGGAKLKYVRHYTDYPTRKYSSNEIHFGAYSIIPINEKVLLRPEILYLSHGFSDRFNFGKKGYYSLSLPVLAGYKFLSKLTLLAGPEVVYTPHYNENSKWNRFYGGMAGGVNYQFWKNFSLDATYTRGLTNIIDRGTWVMPTPYPDFKEVGANTRSSLRLSLAYTFGKNNTL